MKLTYVMWREREREGAEGGAGGRNVDHARTEPERRRKNIWPPSKFSFDCKHPASRSGKARTRTTKINLYIAARRGREGGHRRAARAWYPQLRHIYSCHRAHGGSDDYPRPPGKARRRKKKKSQTEKWRKIDTRGRKKRRRMDSRSISGDVCGRAATRFRARPLGDAFSRLRRR